MLAQRIGGLPNLCNTWGMPRASVQRQARALGDPTRYSLFEWIGSRAEPVSIIDLLEEFQLNHTTIRQHLAQLVEAELIVESRAAPTGPGRPRRLYQVDPAARGGWTHDGPYERLSLLLLDVLRTNQSARDVGRSAGRSTEISHRPGRRAIDAMADEVAREGFAPRVTQHAGHTEMELTNCPFLDAAEVDPGTVCELHRGLAEGLAEAISGVSVTGLVPHSPQRAGCQLQVVETA